MADRLASENQLELLKKLSGGKDYSDLELTSAEASKKIKKLLAEKEGTEEKKPREQSDKNSSLEIDARFRIAALTSVAELLKVEKVAPNAIFSTADSFYDWLAKKKGGGEKDTTEQDWENLKREEEPIKNAGDLFTRAHKRGASQRDVFSIAGVGTIEELKTKDLNQVWNDVKKKWREKEEKPNV